MARTDLPLDDLHAFRSALVAAPDLGPFWDNKLAEARAAAIDLTLSEVEPPLTRVHWSGHDGGDSHHTRASLDWLGARAGLTA